MTSYGSVRAGVQSRWGHQTGPGAAHCPCRFTQPLQLDSSGPWAWAGLGPTRQLALGADCVPSCPFSWQVQRGRGPHLEHAQLHQHLRVCGWAAERARGRDAGHDVSAHGRWAGRSEPNPRRAVAEGTPGPAAVGGFSTAPRLPAHPPHSHPHLHTCLLASAIPCDLSPSASGRWPLFPNQSHLSSARVTGLVRGGTESQGPALDHCPFGPLRLGYCRW